eukprot:763406-Hanusia_phi.AAC.1
MADHSDGILLKLKDAVSEFVAMGYRGLLERIEETSLEDLQAERTVLDQKIGTVFKRWSLRAHPDKGGDCERFQRLGKQVKEDLPKLLDEWIVEMRRRRNDRTMQALQEQMREQKREHAGLILQLLQQQVNRKMFFSRWAEKLVDAKEAIFRQLEKDVAEAATKLSDKEARIKLLEQEVAAMTSKLAENEDRIKQLEQKVVETNQKLNHSPSFLQSLQNVLKTGNPVERAIDSCSFRARLQCSISKVLTVQDKLFTDMCCSAAPHHLTFASIRLSSNSLQGKRIKDDFLSLIYWLRWMEPKDAEGLINDVAKAIDIIDKLTEVHRRLEQVNEYLISSDMTISTASEEPFQRNTLSACLDQLEEGCAAVAELSRLKENQLELSVQAMASIMETSNMAREKRAGLLGNIQAVRRHLGLARQVYKELQNMWEITTEVRARHMTSVHQSAHAKEAGQTPKVLKDWAKKAEEHEQNLISLEDAAAYKFLDEDEDISSAITKLKEHFCNAVAVWTRLVGECSKLEGWFLQAAGEKLKLLDVRGSSVGDARNANKNRVLRLQEQIPGKCWVSPHR